MNNEYALKRFEKYYDETNHLRENVRPNFYNEVNEFRTIFFNSLNERIDELKSNPLFVFSVIELSGCIPEKLFDGVLKKAEIIENNCQMKYARDIENYMIASLYALDTKESIADLIVNCPKNPFATEEEKVKVKKI